jgi:predicted nucleic acid-binding protein
MAVRRVAATLSDILHLVRLTEVGIDDIRSAWALAERYGYSHYDSLIITAALRAGCATLYSEDLQHSQLIDGRLDIVNPFLTSTSP